MLLSVVLSVGYRTTVSKENVGLKGGKMDIWFLRLNNTHPFETSDRRQERTGLPGTLCNVFSLLRRIETTSDCIKRTELRKQGSISTVPSLTCLTDLTQVGRERTENSRLVKVSFKLGKRSAWCAEKHPHHKDERRE